MRFGRTGFHKNCPEIFKNFVLTADVATYCVATARLPMPHPHGLATAAIICSKKKF